MAASLYYLYLIVLLAGSVAMPTVGILIYRRERSNFSGIFLLLVSASTFYVFGYAMELLSRSDAAVLFWGRFQYVGIPFIASLHFLLAVYFSTSEKKVNRAFVIGIFLAPILIVLARQTDHIHHLFYSSYTIVNEGLFLRFAFEKGVLYELAGGYYIFGIFASMLVLAFYYLRVNGTFRCQTNTLLIGTIIYIPVQMALIFGWMKPAVDVIPLVVVMNAGLFTLAIFRYRLLTLVPVARDYIVETMNDAVVVVDHNNLVADANPLAIRYFADDAENPIGRPVSEAFPMIRLDVAESEDTRFNRDDRVWEWEVSRITRKAGAYVGFVIVLRDVTDREKLVAQLEVMAKIDAVTGLLNRRSWQSAVTVELERLARYDRYGSLIYLDLDHFKKINDGYGHAEGDRVLQIVAEVLTATLRRPDLVGRLGGEEFGILLPESSPEDAFSVAERLRRELMTIPAGTRDKPFTVTGSFGVSGCRVDGECSLDDLVSLADHAMYESKRNGRNRITVAASRSVTGYSA